MYGGGATFFYTLSLDGMLLKNISQVSQYVHSNYMCKYNFITRYFLVYFIKINVSGEKGTLPDLILLNFFSTLLVLIGLREVQFNPYPIIPTYRQCGVGVKLKGVGGDFTIHCFNTEAIKRYHEDRKVPLKLCHLQIEHSFLDFLPKDE